MTVRTVFISDIHIGVNTGTNWYQDSVHRNALKGFLRYVTENAAETGDVVILGDWFDQWTYSPDDNPPGISRIMAANSDVFAKQTDRSGDFVSLMESIRGNLRFVNGNHDMLAELKEINAWFSQHTDRRVYPGIGENTAAPAAENTSYQSSSGRIYAEHGHLHDLFNKPALMPANPYKPLPVGHFITRTVGGYVLKQLGPGCPNSAWLKNSGDPSYSNFGIDLKVIVNVIEDMIGRRETPNIAEAALDAVLAFDGTGRLNYNMKWHIGGCPSSDAADDYYPGLFSASDFSEDIRETEVNFEGLDGFAKQHFKKNPLTRVMLMGHTHEYKLVRSPGI